MYPMKVKISSISAVAGLILAFLFVVSTAVAQSLPFLKEPAFQAGEELRYRLRYGFLHAAEGVLTVKNSELQFSSPHAFHLSATGKTTNAFSLLFPVDNRYNSYIDSRTYLPYFYT